MNDKLVAMAIATGFFAVSGSAFADHNSKNGEGWANMPNDIHNTRIETRENDDNDAFRDFVRYGEGSTTENRFDTEDERPKTAAGQPENANTANARPAATSLKQNALRTRTGADDADGTATRSRIESNTRVMSRMRSSTSSRQGGAGRRGRGPR